MSLIRVVNMIEFPAREPTRQGKMDVIVTYVADEQRSYTITIPKEEYTPEKAKELIKKEELERLKLIGQSIDVKPGV